MSQRLFVYGPHATDDNQWLCGGPDPKEAAQGLANVLEHHIWELLDGESESESDLTLIVRDMTDDELAALPDDV